MFKLFKRNKEQKNIQKDATERKNEPQINIESFQSLINEVFLGISMLVRDADLSEKCASKYIPGTIIRELGFTDASFRVGGIRTTHRYAILSNHMGNLSTFEHGTDWGLCVAKHGAHFKVLDVYTYQGKTQIVLLHLPDDERWKMFNNTEISIEKELINTCRSKFEIKCTETVIPELATDEWLARCDSPIGMDETGQLFLLE